MPAMQSELYDALLAANVPDDKARAAAEAALRGTDAVQADVASIKADVGWIKWALAVFVAAHLAEIGMLFNLLNRAG
jgi:hypothetical protein